MIERMHPTAPGESTPPIDRDQMRQQRRIRQRRRMLWMIAASYALDVLALAGFHLTGIVGWQVPLVYALASGSIVGAFLLSSRLGLNENFQDHYLTLPQVMANAAMCLAMAWWVPQVGVLVLSVLFLIAAFGALRLDRSQMLVAAVVVCTSAALLVIGLGERLAMPVASLADRLISGFWIASLVARCMLVGQYGARIREVMLRGRDELARANKALEQLAARDELTGARNRRAILDVVDDARRQHGEGARSYAVALLDLDHFKSVNDRFGHLVGDEVLRAFALTVAGELRSADRLGRYGGEEFLLCLPGVSDTADALRLVERIRTRVQQRDWSQIAPGLAVTVSIGVAVADSGEGVPELLGRADAALYEAKRDGRNRSALG